MLGGEVTRFRGLGVTSESPPIRSGLTYERRVTVVRVDEQLVVRASAPIVDERFELRGVAVLSVPLDSVFADSVKASLGSDVLILAGGRADGQPMSTFLTPIGARVAQVPISASALTRVARGRTAFEESLIDEYSYELGYAPIYDLEGQMVGVFAVAVDRAPLLAARGAATRSLALGAVGAFVFAIGLAGLLSRRISRPLQKLHVGAIAIARGDLDHDIEVSEGDEIGDLATAFAHMTTALKENQRRLAARMREIVALHDAGRAVSSVIELELVLRKVVDSVARVLHVRVCALWIVREGELELGAARAKRADMRTISDRQEVADTVGPLRPLAQEVAQSRVPLHIESMGDASAWREVADQSGVDGSLVAAALERKGAAVGVIIIGRGGRRSSFLSG